MQGRTFVDLLGELHFWHSAGFHYTYDIAKPKKLKK